MKISQLRQKYPYVLKVLSILKQEGESKEILDKAIQSYANLCRQRPLHHAQWFVAVAEELAVI